MAGDMKHLVLKNEYSIAYDKDGYFENGIKKEIPETITDPVEIEKHVKEQAEILKRNFYSNYFKKHYKNIVILTAAGTSLDNGKNKGKTRNELWTHCESEINAFIPKIVDIETKNFYESKDIEGLLSHIILYEKLNNSAADIATLREDLERKIKEACTLTLDKDEAPHKNFLDKITARKSNDPRVQLFTTNYDTLFEQAANEAGFVIIDGFSFTQPRKFSGRYFDYDIVNRDKTRVKQEESFVSKVFHIYKLHGSLNWERDTDNGIIQKENPKTPLIIYPASNKYESSYEQPYFEMMSRFQQALRQDQVLLVVLGFGFQDKHIQNVIIEAVQQNPSFQLVILNYNANETIETTHIESFFEDIKKMKTKRKVTIIFDKFKDFTDNYPDNQTYTEDNNESV